MRMTASWLDPPCRIQDAMGADGETAKLVASINWPIDGSSLMQKHHDDSKACLTAFIQDNTVIAVIEMSLASWVVAGLIPGVNCEPLKKIAADPEVLLLLLYRWRDQALKAGKDITRIAVAYETGRDSFWLARWLRDRGIDAT
jgi:transposase